MTNRIVDAIVALHKRLDVRLGSAQDIPEERALQERLDREMDIDAEEYSVFQERKSLAQASGVLTVDEATSIYAILGSGPADFNAQTLARKVIVTQTVKELLAASLAA